MVSVNLLRCCENDWLNVWLAVLEVLKEVVHVVTLVNKHCLLHILDENLVFSVFRIWVGHVAKVFVLQERVQEDVIDFDEASQRSAFRRLDGWSLWRQLDAIFLETCQVLKDSSRWLGLSERASTNPDIFECGLISLCLTLVLCLFSVLSFQNDSVLSQLVLVRDVLSANCVLLK
jgi:hypothetical protein